MPHGTPSERGPPDHQKELVNLITEVGYCHGHCQVFADFVEMGAIALSNAIDLRARDRREARYMDIVTRYKPEELAKFPQMLVSLTEALQHDTTDVLGKTFHSLELHNKSSGQFFSPYPLCRMMARMILGEKAELEARISERGFVTALEPCVGSGAMVIALAHEIRELGINYQQHLHVTAVDVDPKCVHMSYLQLALLHVPALVIHGNSLSLEEFSHWYTPAHTMGGWDWKLRGSDKTDHHVQSIEPLIQSPNRPDDEEPPHRPSQLTLF
jgi:hypothetical protein